MNRTIVFITAAVLMIVACAIPAGASSTTDPTDARGFVADHLYDFKGTDSIDGFNGNLVLTIPLGTKYRAGDSLTYGFMLSYNANIWDHEERCQVFTAQPWVYDDPLDYIDLCKTESVPHRSSNAGVGWFFTLGEIRQGAIKSNDIPHYAAESWTYTSPDGAEHLFYTSLHGSGESNYPASTAEWSYTRDSSYIRMHYDAVNHMRTVELPDGTKQIFECGTCTQRDPWELKQVRSARGDVLFITYGDQSSPYPGRVWTIKEGDATRPLRTHYVRFERIEGMKPYRLRLKELDLQGVAGARAVYSFGYMDSGVSRILRDPANTNFTPDWLEVPFNADGTITVPLLTSITMPASNGGGAETWRFDYFLDHGGADDYAAPAPPSRSYAGSQREGRLRELGYPTGGAVRYVYGHYRFPLRQCDIEERELGGHSPGLHFKPHFSSTIGVRSRQQLLRDASGQLVPDGFPTIYFSDINIPQIVDRSNECNLPTDFRNIRVDPDGTVHAAYFSAFMGTYDAVYGTDPRDYGLPFTKVVPDPAQAPTDTNRRFLSTEIYQCPQEVLGPTRDITADDTLYATMKQRMSDAILHPQVANGCSKKRSLYVRYEQSGAICGTADFADGTCAASNRRVVSERTVFEDDGTYHLADYSSFDGAGHYRTKVEDGNFGITALGAGAPSDKKTFTTFYNPGLSMASNFSGIPAGIPAWILDTYSYTSAQLGAATALTSYTWDTGFMTGKRIQLASDQISASDVIVTYARTPAPSSDMPANDAAIIVEEVQSGGDPDFNGARHQYRTRSTYRYGALQRAEYLSGAASFLVTSDLTLDPSTGLPLSATDASLARIDYTYDLRGRVTSATPYYDEDPTSYTYRAFNVASPTQPAAVSVARSSATASDQQTLYTFDALGRVSAIYNDISSTAGFDLTRHPPAPPNGSRTSAKYFTYWPMGWKHLESATQNSGSSGRIWTEYADYDAFGRPQSVKWGSESETSGGQSKSYEYKGERFVRETISQIGSAVDGSGAKGHSVATTIERDVYGRPVKVTDWSQNPTPSVPQPNSQFTRYDYDVLGNLTSVQQGVQTRTFIYDNRGFMTKMITPELGTAGRGAVNFGGFDSRGHATTAKYGTGSLLDLFYEFDAGERPRKAWGANQNFGRGDILKEYTYFPGSTAACDGTDCGFSGGKVEFATRHNYVPLRDGTGNLHDVAVQEHFRYAGPAGRVSEVATTVLRDGLAAPDNSFTASFAYDTLGNVDSISYPGCSACGAAPPARSVESFYQYGQLKAVRDAQRVYASNIQYTHSGMVSSIAHGNGATDTWEEDAGLGRPLRISVSNAAGAPLWQSGNYVYDGAQNILSIGPDRYVYDQASRVISASVSGVLRNYEYDRYGNMTRFNAGNAWDYAVPVEASSNHFLSDPATRVKYDPAGNMTAWKDPRLGAPSWVTNYTFDSFNQMKHIEGPSLFKNFIYDAADERTAVIDFLPQSADPANPVPVETWSMRGLDHQVLRDYTKQAGAWGWKEDYVYRGSSLLTSILPGTGPSVVRHYHADHLGSPRRLTDGAGAFLFRHIYYPFGEEQTQNADTERMKFTGHERDVSNTSGPLGNLDSMHARYYNSMLARFLAVDPSGHSADPLDPLSWNRYTYAANNPLKFMDPNGREKLRFELTTRIPTATVTLPMSFGGVNRVFRGDGDSATFRTRQTFTIETDQRKAGNPLLSKSQIAGTTIEYNGDGSVKATAHASYVGTISGAFKNGNAVVGVTTDSTNPLVTGAPAINTDLQIVANSAGAFTVGGSIDGFPSAKLTVTNEQGQTSTVFDFDPRSVGNGPFALMPVVGDQQINVSCGAHGTCGKP